MPLSDTWQAAPAWGQVPCHAHAIRLNHGDHHAAPSTRAPATPTHLLGSPQRSLVSEEGASVTRGSVRERRLEMQRRWLAMQANLARLHRMLRSSDAGGNGRRYGEERGSAQENSPGRFVQSSSRVLSWTRPKCGPGMNTSLLPEPSSSKLLRLAGFAAGSSFAWLQRAGELGSPALLWRPGRSGPFKLHA